MISIVCVYNNEKILKNVLLKGLQEQTAEFELITIDNTDQKYNSAAEALNHGGVQAESDYIMFIHQDMWLPHKTWLAETEKILKNLGDLGVAGVLGASDTDGARGKNVLHWSIEDFGLMQNHGDRSDKTVEKVLTLDECLLIIPKKVFNRLKFDEKTFDGWDCYGADYCLCAKELGLNIYVIPQYCSHCNVRSHYKLWEFKGLLKYQKKMYFKHKQNYKRIPTWMGEISWITLTVQSLKSFFGTFYLKTFPDFIRILKKELYGYHSILDLGCGHHSQLSGRKGIFSVGVDLFLPYLQESKRKAIHNQYIKADVTNIEFKPKSFDVVLAIEVLEHLEKNEGIELIKKMKLWAKSKIILTTPNGYIPQDEYDKNPYQTHKSSWTDKEFERLGFKVHGLSGYKKLRGEKGLIKYRPVFLWEKISKLSQKIVYYYKNQAFQLLAVKIIN